MKLRPSYAQNQEFVRPGFELGYKTEDGKYYIYNHLVFNILVTLTHGEYMAAREKYDNMGLESLENRHHRRQLSNNVGSSSTIRGLHRGTGKDLSSVGTSAVESDASVEARRRLTADDPPATAAADNAFYMVVGFEVSPCSIKREAGKAIDDVVCGVDDDSHFAAQVREADMMMW